MGDRGPEPKTKHQANITGSQRATKKTDNPVNSIPITSKKADGTAPSFFSAEELDKWNNIVPILQNMKMMSEADTDRVIEYCQAWVKLQEAERHLKDHGQFYRQLSRDGVESWKRNPASAASKELLGQIHRLAAMLGLSPKAREAFKDRAHVPTDYRPQETGDVGGATAIKSKILQSLRDGLNSKVV